MFVELRKHKDVEVKKNVKNAQKRQKKHYNGTTRNKELSK